VFLAAVAAAGAWQSAGQHEAVPIQRLMLTAEDAVPNEAIRSLTDAKGRCVVTEGNVGDVVTEGNVGDVVTEGNVADVVTAGNVGYIPVRSADARLNSALPEVKMAMK
jgi:hypothetical protein